jgi:predicted peptidase
MTMIRLQATCRLLVVSVFAASIASAQEPPASTEVATDPRESIKAFEGEQVFTGTEGHALDYRLEPPREFEEGARYPLVLCLHGVGGGTQAGRVLSKRQPEPCFVLVPSVRTKEFSWAGRRIKAMPTVLELIDDLVQRLPIDPDRIYVTGQSMGGQGTWGAIAARPDFFAAAVPVCGGWQTSDAERIKHVPVWVFHGDADKVVPTRYSREMVEALRSVGGTPKYTEYPGVSHNSWTRAYDTEALWTWLFEQRRARSGSAGDDAPAAEAPVHAPERVR